MSRTSIWTRSDKAFPATKGGGEGKLFCIHWTLEESHYTDSGVTNAMSGWWIGDSGPSTALGNLETSGKSLGERLTAGLGGGVRPEWHTDVRPRARPRLRGWDNSLIRGPRQPEGATKCLPPQLTDKFCIIWQLISCSFLSHFQPETFR